MGGSKAGGLAVSRGAGADVGEQSVNSDTAPQGCVPEPQRASLREGVTTSCSQPPPNQVCLLSFLPFFTCEVTFPAPPLWTAQGLPT